MNNPHKAMRAFSVEGVQGGENRQIRKRTKEIVRSKFRSKN